MILTLVVSERALVAQQFILRERPDEFSRQVRRKSSVPSLIADVILNLIQDLWSGWSEFEN